MKPTPNTIQWLAPHLSDGEVQAIYEAMLGVIGDYWPTHCAKGFDNCDQCRNREVLNGQIYEQRKELNRLFGKETG